MYTHMMQVLGIIDKLNDWNEKLNGFASEHLDNVWVGALAVGIIFVVGCWGVNALNKRQ